MLLLCVIWKDTFANWLMAGGAITSAIILICTLKKQNKSSVEQKEQFLQSRFDDHFYNMVQTFNSKIEGLYYSEKRTKTENGKQVNYDEIHHGVNVFKKFSFMYLKKVNLNLPEEKKEAAFQEIHKTYHSYFKQLIHTIIFIFEYVETNIAKNEIIDYRQYIKLNIPEYLKFIIALYKIYSPHSIGAKRLIKDFKIISLSDFKNFITDTTKHQEFMAKVNE